MRSSPSRHPAQQYPQNAGCGRPCTRTQPAQGRPMFRFQCSRRVAESAIARRGRIATLEPKSRPRTEVKVDFVVHGCMLQHIWQTMCEIHVQTTVTPPCSSSVQEKRYTSHKDEQLSDAMLFLSGYQGFSYLLPCSLWILTELVRISPAAPPNELRCTPTASKVTLSPDRSSSGQEYMLQCREAAAPCGIAEPFQQCGGVFLGPE